MTQPRDTERLLREELAAAHQKIDTLWEALRQARHEVEETAPLGYAPKLWAQRTIDAIDTALAAVTAGEGTQSP